MLTVVDFFIKTRIQESMHFMSFEINYYALLLVLLILGLLFPLWRWRSRFRSPSLLYPHLSDLIPADSFSLRRNLAFLPRWLKYASCGFFLLAFIDPRIYLPKTSADSVPKEGIAIYLVADRSGSMAQKVRFLTEKGTWENIPKIDLLKQITRAFIEGNSLLGLPGRPNDLIGLTAFARTAQVEAPLTLDHRAVVDQLTKLQVVQNKEDDGTAIGYALYKTTNIIDATRHYAHDLVGRDLPSYEMKSAIIILITDGFHAPSPFDQGHQFRNIDLDTAANYAKEKDVKIYLISIEPALASAQFTPHRNLMQRVAERTGGKYYHISDQMSLSQIYADIDKLEKGLVLPSTSLSKDDQPNLYKVMPLYPYFIAAGMLALGLAIVLYTILLRRVP